MAANAAQRPRKSARKRKQTQKLTQSQSQLQQLRHPPQEQQQQQQDQKNQNSEPEKKRVHSPPARDAGDGLCPRASLLQLPRCAATAAAYRPADVRARTWTSIVSYQTARWNCTNRLSYPKCCARWNQSISAPRAPAHLTEESGDEGDYTLDLSSRAGAFCGDCGTMLTRMRERQHSGVLQPSANYASTRWRWQEIGLLTVATYLTATRQTTICLIEDCIAKNTTNQARFTIPMIACKECN